MGRAAVRIAVANYFTNANLANVGTVYSARPTIVSEQDYEQTMLGQAVAGTTNGSNAVLVVNLPHSHRQRMADTGRGAVNDTDRHKVAMEVYFVSRSGDALAAQNDHDAILDALTVLVRSDPTLGAQIWSAGEYAAGIDVDQAEPYTDEEGLTIFIPTVFKFEVWEWIAGTGV